MNDELRRFYKQRETNIDLIGSDRELKESSYKWIADTSKYNYTYNFNWLGRPIIQFPQDMVALQEIIWAVKPDLIIETGIAHGGSLIFSASMLALLEISGFIKRGQVLGIDIDIRKYNKIEIENHPLSEKIKMIQGSSVSADIVNEVKDYAINFKNILVCLDSNHTHKHVLDELNAYAALVSLGSYCIVYDTAIEDMPENFFADRPWGKGNNPKTAVWEFLKSHPEFEIDKNVENKLLITVAPDGYLLKVR